jgi:type I restriction enzyme, R subunit
LIPRKKETAYETDFKDTLLGIKEPSITDPQPEPPVPENYEKKVKYYLEQHEDIPAIKKLRNNEPLQQVDLDDLGRPVMASPGNRGTVSQSIPESPPGRICPESRRNG